MAVELHPFLQASIHPLAREVLRLLNTHYRAQGQFAVKLVNSRHTLDLNKRPRLDGRL